MQEHKSSMKPKFKNSLGWENYKKQHNAGKKEKIKPEQPEYQAIEITKKNTMLGEKERFNQNSQNTIVYDFLPLFTMIKIQKSATREKRND